jgi:hypothetical protein
VGSFECGPDALHRYVSKWKTLYIVQLTFPFLSDSARFRRLELYETDIVLVMYSAGAFRLH